MVRHAWTAEWDAELTWLAREACYLLPEGSGLPPLAPSSEAMEFSDPESGLYFEIWDGDLLFSDRSPSLGERSLPLPASFPSAASAGDVRLPDGPPLRLIAQEVRIPLPNSQNGTVRFNVAVARDRAPLDDRLGQLLLKICGAICGVFLLTVLFIRFSIQHAFRPLRELENQIETIGATSLEQRLNAAWVPGEVKPMVDGINRLLQRLSESFERESRFTSDVAHELRTPVAELTALAEVRATWPDRASPSDDKEFLRIGWHMKRQIETLLTLARLDQGNRSVVRESVDLVDLITASWEPLAGAAEARHLDVDLPASPAPLVEGDPGLLAIIVRNLLENALAYTPIGGHLRVAVRRTTASEPILLVENKVDSPASLDASAMFDRFWRADGARTGEGHSGLGLTLCRSCAAAMGLDLVAEVELPSRSLCMRLAERPGHEKGQMD